MIEGYYNKKQNLEKKLEKERKKLAQTKSVYPFLPIISAAGTGVSTYTAVNNAGMPGSGIIYMFIPIFAGFTLVSWYLGHKAVKESKGKISILEKELECL